MFKEETSQSSKFIGNARSTADGICHSVLPVRVLPEALLYMLLKLYGVSETNLCTPMRTGHCLNYFTVDTAMLHQQKTNILYMSFRSRFDNGLKRNKGHNSELKLKSTKQFSSLVSKTDL